MLRTHRIGTQPSMKYAHHAVTHASGVLDSCVEPKMRISLCDPETGGLRSCSRTVKKGPRVQSGPGRCELGTSLHGGLGFDSYMRCS